jgi:protein-tyrosine phosphatase
MQNADITHVWSLTERPASASLFPDGVTVHHEPIADYGVPSAAYLDRVVGEIEAVVRGGKSALVHCQGGMGRTGTVLACVVAKLDNVSGDVAIAHLRTLFHAVETEQQEKAVSQ